MRRRVSLGISLGRLFYSRRLPTIVADTDTNAYTRCPEADAGARAVIPITIAAALDVSLARRITVGVPDDHAAAAACTIASSVLITDHANLLQQIRVRVFAARIDVRGIC